MIKELVDKLTLEEKAALLTGGSAFATAEIKRLGIPALTMADGPSGVRRGKAVCYPAACALACSFSEDAAEGVARAIASECRDRGVNVLLGPGINIKRSPLCGRNFEYYSEDPYLTGLLASAYVRGLQDEGVGACVKHFAANNREYRRMVSDSIIDEAALYEIYLSAFRKVIETASPYAVMTSYNLINGSYVSESKELLDSAARKEWGFEGVFISDWGGIDDIVAAVNAGTNIEMPANLSAAEKIVAAVRDNRLDVQVLNERVEQNLTFAFNKYAPLRPCDYAANLELARGFAAECAVLLKNEGGVLPLDKSAKLLVVGEMAVKPRIQGSGSARVDSIRTDEPFACIKREFADAEFVLGYSGEKIDRAEEKRAVSAAVDCDAVVIFAGLTDELESEGYDRQSLDMPANQISLIRRLCRVNKKVVVALAGGGIVDMRWDRQVPAVLFCPLMGDGMGSAVAKILTGEVNPSGKLAETVPCKEKDEPSYPFFSPGGNKVFYGESLFVGYRHYDRRDIDVKYEFGFGLSYTAFRATGFSLEKSKVKRGERVALRFFLENVGERSGSEVIQLYVARPNGCAQLPSRELKAVKKVFLRAGEGKEILMHVDYADLRGYISEIDKFDVIDGKYELFVGNSSRKFFFNTEFETEGIVPVLKIDRNSLISDILKVPGGKKIVEDELLGFLCLAYYGNFNIEVKLSDSGATGDKTFDGILNNMPLRALVNFSSGQFSEGMLDGIVKRLSAEE